MIVLLSGEMKQGNLDRTQTNVNPAFITRCPTDARFRESLRIIASVSQSHLPNFIRTPSFTHVGPFAVFTLYLLISF